MSNIIQFSKNKDTNITSAINEKSKFKILIRTLIYNISILFRKVLNKIGLPAIIRESIINDELTNQKITIKTNLLFTILTVNGRDYYFSRLSGKFDGTGSSLTIPHAYYK